MKAILNVRLFMCDGELLRRRSFSYISTSSTCKLSFLLVIKVGTNSCISKDASRLVTGYNIALVDHLLDTLRMLAGKVVIRQCPRFRFCKGLWLLACSRSLACPVDKICALLFCLLNVALLEVFTET